MNRIKYIVTPIYDYINYNLNHVYETEDYRITTISFFSNSALNSERYSALKNYLDKEGFNYLKSYNKILSMINDCPDYFGCIVNGFILSKYEYFNEVEFSGIESLYHSYFLKTLVLLGLKIKYSKQINISEYTRYREAEVLIDYSGYSKSLEVNQFSFNYINFSNNEINIDYRVIDETFRRLIWIYSNDTSENIATNHLVLSLDYFFNSFTINEKKIAYVNLVMIIELLFKWNEEERGSEITKHLSEFITNSPHYRSSIRKKCNGDNKIFNTRNQIVHGEIVSNESIKANHKYLYNYVNKALLKLLELSYLNRDNLDSIDTNDKFHLFLENGQIV